MILSEGQGFSQDGGGEDERARAQKRKKGEEKTTRKRKKTEERERKESGDRRKKEAKMAREEKMLDKLAGMGGMEEEEDNFCKVFSKEEGATRRVTTTLRDHYSHWEKTGASKFSLSVIGKATRLV